MARSETKWECPVIILSAYPYLPSSSLSKIFQMIKDLSLDPEIKIGESSFSLAEKPAAIQVTQLECPSKTP